MKAQIHPPSRNLSQRHPAHMHIFRLSNLLGTDDPTLVEHERVVRAILRHNPDRAAEAMAEHLARSLQRRLSGDEES